MRILFICVPVRVFDRYKFFASVFSLKIGFLSWIFFITGIFYFSNEMKRSKQMLVCSLLTSLLTSVYSSNEADFSLDAGDEVGLFIFMRWLFLVLFSNN